MDSIFDEPIEHRGTGSIKWDQYGDPDIIALSTADMDFRSPETVRLACEQVAAANLYNYRFKTAAFYDAIIDYYQRKFGWQVDRGWITNGPGIWTTSRVLVGAFCRPGDRVIIQSPHFSPIPPLIADAGCGVVTNPMRYVNGRYELDLVDFAAKVKEHRPKAYFLVNPQNPTGRTFTRAELTALAAICAEYGVLVISDEVHCNIQFPGSVHTPFPSIPGPKSILIHAASKSYNLMGLTFCVVIIPDEGLRREWTRVQSVYNMSFASNIYGVVATTAAFGAGSDPWLAAVTDYLEANLEYALEYFAREIPRIKTVRPDGGYLLWLDCRDLGMKPAELKGFFLHEAKVGLTYGESYGPEGEGFERLNFAVTRSTLTEGLRRIRDAVNRR